MRIDARPQKFIAGLKCVAAANEREVVLETGSFVDINRLSFREAEVKLTPARGLEYGHGFRTHIRYAEFRGPILPEAVGKTGALTPVPTEPHFVDRRGIDDERIRDGHLALVDRNRRGDVIQI